MKKFLAALVIPAFFPAFAQSGLIANEAMVVSARTEASEIGLEIIRKGGNAFDAMIATELALAVPYPYAGNIGGGGFMVYRLKNGDTGTLDYREKAPMAATKDMFVDDKGNTIPNKSTETAFAVGVPGTIAGLFAVHEKFGSMPIKALFEPAIALAKKGVVITQKQLAQIDSHKEVIIRLNGRNSLFSKTFNVGDTVRYLAFSRTLERIAKGGKSEFYKGRTARKLAQYLQRKGGILTRKDLEMYEAKWRKPVTFKYRGLNIISMGPPSSGGICLAQIFGMLEQFDVKELGHNSQRYIQLLAEAERRSYADRNFYLGDPDFAKIPTTKLIDSLYLLDRMADFSFNEATKSVNISRGTIQFSESDETTHYSIVDSNENAVSVTTTLNGAFGSKLYCDELGFFLNNEMDDFSAKPGVANSYGLIGAEANSIAPGKRMLSSMTPTIVEKDGKLLMVLGSPGGSTIITSVLQTILNVYEFGMGMHAAVSMPRFHHQWLPDEVNFEPNKFPKETLDELTVKGYMINEKSLPILGKVDAILIRNDGTIEAGADPRGDDAAAGF